MKKKNLLFIICLINFAVGTAWSQEVLIELDHNPVLKALPKGKINKTKLNNEPLTLPFFDDFSRETIYPDQRLWTDNYAYINQSYPILPPTIGVATLDALDAQGNLYKQASVVPFGADTLTSHKIRLDSLITSSSSQKLSPKDSVYLSFYYQPGGGYGKRIDRTGSTPGEKDSLILEFYNSDSLRWEYAWGTGGFELDSLYTRTGYFFDFVMIPIVDTSFFSNDFQFRFRNYCSLAPESYARNSNCDQWHIDYIYLNRNRSYMIYDTTVMDIAFVSSAESVLEKYDAMPAKQYNENELKEGFHNLMINLYFRPMSCEYNYYIYDDQDNIIDTYLGGTGVNINPFFPDFNYHNYLPHTAPPVKADAFANMNSDKKNVFKICHVIFQGIGDDEHPQNDTASFEQIFDNYYAYDDGSAENGYGLEVQNGSPKIAYRLQLNKQDTLTAISIHFNQTFNNSNNIEFKIVVWSNAGGKPGNILYEDNRYRNLGYRDSTGVSGINEPDMFILEQPILVEDTIYFGIIQRTKGFINIGFDRNRNASQHVFYDAGSGWENSFLPGALMMRPYFGEKATVGINNPKPLEIKCKIYPNPTSKFINIELMENISENKIETRIFDIMGKRIYEGIYKKTIDISHLGKGVYILQLLNKETSQYYVEKIIITN